MPPSLPQRPVTPAARAVLGFALGLSLMLVATRIFIVNSFDFDNMARGAGLLLAGVNPWAAATRIPHFYNPPFAVLFLWPMRFTTPQVYLALGAACLFAFVFYQRAWTALAWFATNTLLWLIAAGGIDMFLVGAGLLLLTAGDRAYRTWSGLALRVLGYGILMVKPQAGLFIAGLYLLTRRDWKGALLAAAVYGLPFLHLYPDWLRVLISDPPLAQTEATHTIWARFGPLAAALVAGGAALARRWQYWQFAGVLAGALTPYGMPGVPAFLVLTAVRPLRAIPMVVLWSAGLALMTWVNPPAGVDYYDYIQPLMAIYHLGMFSLALTLACLSPEEQSPGEIDVRAWLRRFGARPKDSPA